MNGLLSRLKSATQLFPWRFTALSVIYVGVVIVLWAIALGQDMDNSRSAAIAAASACTVAGAAILGGWVNAWRENSLQFATAWLTERRVAYTQLLDASSSYVLNARRIKEQQTRAADVSSAMEVREAAEALELSHRRSTDGLIERALAACSAVELVGPDAARLEASSIRSSVEAQEPLDIDAIRQVLVSCLPDLEKSMAQAGVN